MENEIRDFIKETCNTEFKNIAVACFCVYSSIVIDIDEVFFDFDVDELCRSIKTKFGCNAGVVVNIYTLDGGIVCVTDQ